MFNGSGIYCITNKINTKPHSVESKDKMAVAKLGKKRGAYVKCSCGECATCKRRAYSAAHYQQHSAEIIARRMMRYYTSQGRQTQQLASVGGQYNL